MIELHIVYIYRTTYLIELDIVSWQPMRQNFFETKRSSLTIPNESRIIQLISDPTNHCLLETFELLVRRETFPQLENGRLLVDRPEL